MSIDTGALAKEIAVLHNEMRLKHGSNPVTRSPVLDAAAQAYANKMVKEDKYEADADRKYGENITMVYLAEGERPDPKVWAKSVMDAFYDESKDYDYSHANIDHTKSCHFTQIIWRDVKHIGVGVAIQDTRPKLQRYSVKICIKYDPPGNLPTQESYNRNVKPVAK